MCFKLTIRFWKASALCASIVTTTCAAQSAPDPTQSLVTMKFEQPNPAPLNLTSFAETIARLTHLPTRILPSAYSARFGPYTRVYVRPAATVGAAIGDYTSAAGITWRVVAGTVVFQGFSQE